jgi:hypothetical protein
MVTCVLIEKIQFKAWSKSLDHKTNTQENSKAIFSNWAPCQASNGLVVYYAHNLI